MARQPKSELERAYEKVRGVARACRRAGLVNFAAALEEAARLLGRELRRRRAARYRRP